MPDAQAQRASGMPNPLDIWGVLGTHCGFHLGRSILIFTKGIIMKAFTNNAADASPEAIEVSGHWSHGELRLVIRDFGPVFRKRFCIWPVHRSSLPRWDVAWASVCTYRESYWSVLAARSA